MRSVAPGFSRGFRERPKNPEPASAGGRERSGGRESHKIAPATTNHRNLRYPASIFAASTKSARVNPSTLCVQIVIRTLPHAR